MDRIDKTRLHLNEIVLLHCIVVLMIFICHIFQKLNLNSIVAELLLTGVPLFLFVSGYLTGISKSEHGLKWMIKRCKRILIPYYTLLIIIFLSHIVFDKNSVSISWTIFFANIQGLKNFVFLNDIYEGLEPPVGGGLGHFWYVTVIMICYLLVFVAGKVNVVKDRMGGAIFALLIAWPLFLLIDIQLNYILIFFYGFYFARCNIKYTIKGLGLLTLLVAAVIVTRFLAKNIIDGSLYYNEFIAQLTTNIIAIWVFYFVFYVGTMRSDIIKTMASWKIVLALDLIIYEFYLTHHVFIKGSLSVFNYVEDELLAVVAIVLVSLLSSVVLYKVCGLIKI